MNQKERKETIKRNWHKYHIPGCTPVHTLKRNCIFISTANGLKHELKKLEICYEIKKLGGEFITEAVRNKKEDGKERRVDIVNLVTADEIEIETNHKVKKPGAITIYI